MTTNKQIIALANTTSAFDAVRQGLIRCGFELEFQAVNGCTEESPDCGCDDEDGCSCSRSYPCDIIDEANIEVGSDQSVRGGEARTIGALTPGMFIKTATALFSGYDFEVDTGCSFHIHLSVPGVKHKYGIALQSEMFAYILSNTHRLPNSVKERLNSKSIRYFKFELSTDKFTAVHAHGLNTWEFRLFGNITNEHDALKCLMLAIDAMRHAYRVRLRKNKSLVYMDLVDNMKDIATKVLGENSDLNSIRRMTLLKQSA
jgi:hypothetical protein